MAGVALALAAIAAAAPSAHAARGPCIPGTKKPKCHLVTGKVGPVDDGDTINVDVDGDGRRRLAKIRLTGIQAMELTSYSRKRGRAGECNSVEATERLERLIRSARSRVRIAAQRKGSVTGRRGRLRRAIAVRSRGRWVDVAEVLLREGLALWFPNGQEWAWNGRYSRLAEDAARRGVGIWNPRSCSAGAPPGGPLRLKVKWDAEDDDSRNVNGEWARITNPDPVTPVSLRGWWFRDTHLRRYTFPATAVVPPLGSVTLRVGRGTNDADTFHWGLRESVFENATSDRKQMGDGGYLFDPRGNLRAHVQYPCRTACSEALAGKVHVEAAYRSPEYVRVRNVSNEVVNLHEYEIESRPWFYEFLGRDAILAPRQSVAVYVQQAPAPDSMLFRSWRHSDYLLSDNRDAVTLRNPAGAPVHCHSWGGERCPDV